MADERRIPVVVKEAFAPVRRSSMRAAHLAFLAAIALHGLDHVRQGLDRLTPHVLIGGAVLALTAAAVLPLTLREHPRAPATAVVVGGWTAITVLAAHVAPRWSSFSDPYPAVGADPASWTVMLAEVVAALVFAGVGAMRLPLGGRR